MREGPKGRRHCRFRKLIIGFRRVRHAPLHDQVDYCVTAFAVLNNAVEEILDDA